MAKHFENCKFRLEVTSYRDVEYENRFQELSDFALSRVVLPDSNEEVENFFRQSILRQQNYLKGFNVMFTFIHQIRIN